MGKKSHRTKRLDFSKIFCSTKMLYTIEMNHISRLICRDAIFNDMKNIRTIIFLLFLTAFGSVSAQEIQSLFERINLEQGLSQRSIFSIAQDQKGFLWFATQEGLNKYDGYSFKIYRHTSFDSLSVSDNYITNVVVDRNGTLWVGTQFGGLNKFESSTESFRHYPAGEDEHSTISENYVLTIYEDRKGSLWIGTINGLNKKEPDEERFSRYFPDPARQMNSSRNIINKVFEDRGGRLWLGMFGSIGQFNQQLNSFSYFKVSRPITMVNGFAEDSLGTLWSVATEGVFRLEGESWMLEESLLQGEKKFDGESIIKDAAGNFWIGTKHGLIHFNPYTKRGARYVTNPFDPRSLSGNTVLSLFEDRTGILWIGTYDGISKYAPRQSRFRHIMLTPDRIKNEGGGWNKVRSFAEESNGTIWIATQEGMIQYDRRSDELLPLNGKNAFRNLGGTNTVWALTMEQKSNDPTLWLGSNGNGLIAMKNFSGKSISPVYSHFREEKNNPASISGNTIWSLCRSSTGALWIGTLMEGLNLFDPKNNSFTRFRFQPDDETSLSNNTVWSVYEEKNGTVWIGTAGGGLNKFNRETKRFIRYQNDPRRSNSISDNKITSIIQDRSGILWIGTYAGLNRFDPNTETFKVYTMKDGLPNEVIYAILDDDRGDLWISTNKGLSRFNIASESFRNYDIGDGLQNNEFNMGAAFRSQSGELFFGGVNGFNIFRPETITDNPAIPPVVITDIKLSGTSLAELHEERRVKKEISEIDTLVLSYKDAVFSLNFSALDFNNPLKNKYTFMMEGFDREWRNAGEKREATYTNIDPGEYRFRVKASNNDGVWNEVGASLIIIITPPWWETFWFRMLLAAGFLSVGPIIYFRRVSVLKKKNMQQQEFSRRLIESQEQERKRIAAELHDSVGQDLLIIKNKLLLETEQNNQNDIVDYISKSLKNVREISRNLRPIQLDQLGLTTALESVLETVADSSRIKFTTHLDIIDNLLTKENEINLFRIVQESLNNILKHSNATEVTVEMKKISNSLSLMIKDNGVGITQNITEHAGFGMSSMHERARILGGTIEIISQSGEGTTIRLIIPFSS